MASQSSRLGLYYNNSLSPTPHLQGFSCDYTDSIPRNLQMFQDAKLSRRNRLYKMRDPGRLIQKHKVNLIVRNIIKKTRLNSIYRCPSQIQDVQPTQRSTNQSMVQKIKKQFEKIKKMKGLKLSNTSLILWNIINIIQITIMVFIFCIMLAFPETQNLQTFRYFRFVSICLYFVDMCLNLVVKRYQYGKHMEEIGDIAAHYLKREFTIDLISMLNFPINYLLQTESIMTFISFIAIYKLVNSISKFQKLSYLLINTRQKEHYYGLIKVFLTNFAIAHFLSIILNLMTMLNKEINWQIKLGINDAEWAIKYVWGYYWGTNIMLTVGFGDISAQNQYEAILLVFIQTFSCITLAYNINYVGAVIGSIRSREDDKKKQLKVFHRMCEENFVSNQMEAKVVCHIEEEYRIKQSFEFEDQDKVLKSLPKNLEVEFRKQAHKTLFDNIGFLNNLTKKSLFKLAEIIGRKICYPEQIIVAKGGVSDFAILQKGCLSYNCRIWSDLDGVEIQEIGVKESEKPKILSLDFIKNKTINYNIKSKTYSVLYQLSRDQVMECLKGCEIDHQVMCQLKDKDDPLLDHNNLYLCSVCKTEYHNKFECSRLHYIPLGRNIILKHLHTFNNSRQARISRFQRQKSVFRPCFHKNQLKLQHLRHAQENFDQDHYLEIVKLETFYDNITTVDENSSIIIQDYRGKLTELFQSNQIKMSMEKTLLNEKTLLKLENLLENMNKESICVWDIETDIATNFFFYFKEANPDQVVKFKKRKVMKKKNYSSM